MTVLLIVGVILGADSSDVAALKKQREDLAKQITAKQKELREIYNHLRQSAELVAAQKDITAAYKALADKESFDPEVKAAKKMAQEANQALDRALETAVAASPEGAALQKQINDARSQIKAAEAALAAAQKKMREVRSKVEKDNPQVSAARKATRKAFEEQRSIVAKKAAAEKEAVKKARAAFDEAAEKACAANPKVTALRQELTELHKQDQDLSRKLREATKGQKTRPDQKKPGDNKRGPAREAQLIGLPAGVDHFRAICTNSSNSFRELEPVQSKATQAQLTLPVQSLLTLTNWPKQ
jgi:chromosome segregation ATPase